MSQLVTAFRVLAFMFWISAAISAAKGFDTQHKKYSALLAKYVRNSLVDYQGLKKDSSKLEAYLSDVAELTMPDYAALSRNDKMAYLINAYNAYTLKMVSDFYPVKSI